MMTNLRLFVWGMISLLVFGEGDIEREAYPRARLSWFPPLFPETVLTGLGVEGSQEKGLRDLYDATNATSSPHFLNWFRPFDDPLHTHYCNFTGVSCDSELYVIRLDLNESGLSGTIPDSIRNLERLRWFKVWMNFHIGTIPSAFGELQHLEHLILGQNSFSGSIPSELGNAYMLKRVLIQSNDITGTIPTDLCKLSHLRALDFSRNSGMFGTLPSCLGDLPNLRYVRIRDSGLTGEIPLELCARSDYGCDGVACRDGSFQFPDGRQTSSSTPCLECPTFSSFIGRTHCEGNTSDSHMPSMPPTMFPSTLASTVPSAAPTSSPPRNPSTAPSMRPTVGPSMFPSDVPSIQPSDSPSLTTRSDVPSIFPTEASSRSIHPSAILSFAPSIGPSFMSRDPSVQPSVAPSYIGLPPFFSRNSLRPTLAFSSMPTSLPVTDASSATTPSPTQTDLSESPTSEPATTSLSPSSDFVVGGLNHGEYQDDSPEVWTWGVLAVILCVAACVLFGLVILGRRRRQSETEQGDSVECLTDVDSDMLCPSSRHEPVDPFCFPEIKEQVINLCRCSCCCTFVAQLILISRLLLSPRLFTRNQILLGSRTTHVSSTLTQRTAIRRV